MEAMTADQLTSESGPNLYNGPLETGIRSVVLLNAVYPKALDITHLTWFDHLVVHTSDVGGPVSMHPDLPQRTGELLVRRRLIEDGLRFMQRLHLVEMLADKSGIQYRATDEAPPLISVMCSPYAEALKICAKWIGDNVATLPEDRIRGLIADRIGNWHIEFQSASSSGN
jgi:hypothetical protein